MNFAKKLTVLLFLAFIASGFDGHQAFTSKEKRLILVKHGQPWPNQPLNYHHIIEQAFNGHEVCVKYTNGDDFNLIPTEWSPRTIIKRCFNYAIDYGLKTICDEGEDLKVALEHYREQGYSDWSDQWVAKVNSLIYLNTEARDAFLEKLLAMGNNVDDIYNVVKMAQNVGYKGIRYQDDFHLLGSTGGSMVQIAATTEVCDFTDTINNKIKRVCPEIDLSRFEGPQIYYKTWGTTH